MFPTKILLATDGSAEAGWAARMATTVSKRLDSELHVVYVAPMPDPLAWPEVTVLDSELSEQMRERAEKDGREALDTEMEKLKAMGAETAGSHVRVGRPDAEIVRLAEELDAGIVVVGSRGLGLLRRALLGSVSNSVVRHAHGSVLVVRGNGREGSYLPGRILLALDGSKGADAAARIAAEISAATGSELHILDVLNTEPYRPYPGPEYREGWEADLERAKRHMRAFLDEHARQIRAEGVKVGDAHLALGDAEKEIVRFAEDMHADLIVVGSRGLGRVKRALMGSVSDSVVRYAHCPVLVVRE